MASIVLVTSEEELTKNITSNDRKLIALYFEASFAQECANLNSILDNGYASDADFLNVVILKVTHLKTCLLVASEFYFSG